MKRILLSFKNTNYISIYFLISLLLFLIYYMHLDYSNNMQQSLKNQSIIISTTIQDIFDISYEFINPLRCKIAETKDLDIQKIATIIGKDSDETHYLPWLNIGWINSDNMLLYSRKMGFVDPAYNLSHRPYVQNCKRFPGKFFSSQIVIGASAGFKQIPSGIGIINKKGQYIGILSVGFKVADIEYRIQERLNTANLDHNMSYIVLDQESHIVLKSLENKIDTLSSYFKNILLNDYLLIADQAILERPIQFKNITYTHYKKTKNFPFTILTGYDKNLYLSNFLLKLCPTFFIFIFIILICNMLFSFKKKQIYQYFCDSLKAKYFFLSSLEKKTSELIKKIDFTCDELLKSYNHELNFDVSEHKKMTLIYKIQNFSYKIIKTLPEQLNFSFVNINDIIKACHLILLYSILIKEIQIKFFLRSDLEKLMGDQLRLKQIIIGIMSLSLNYSPRKSKMSVMTSYAIHDNQNCLLIIVEDNGFSLSLDQLKHIEKKNENNSDIDVDLNTIETLIKMHGGKLEIEPQKNIGKKFILIFPYSKEIFEEKYSDQITSQNLTKDSIIFH